MVDKQDLILRIRELTDVVFERDSAVSEQAQLLSLLTQFMENEARLGSIDLTLSKSLTLCKAQVNLAFLSLNRDCWMYNTAVCI